MRERERESERVGEREREWVRVRDSGKDRVCVRVCEREKMVQLSETFRVPGARESV